MYLFFFVCRLRVEGAGLRTKTPVIYLRYKAASDGLEDVEFAENILHGFCFPFGPEAVQPKEVQASEEYTIATQSSDGRRYTGFCRQIFPPPPRVGSKARYPQVLCIVAENPWCNFFFKVLQIAEQILKSGDGLLDSGHAELPLDSQLGCFLDDLRKQLSTDPSPGEVLRVSVPNLLGLQGVSPPRYLGGASAGESLNWSDDKVELQVPPDCGNGKANSGIPLARLLFHLPAEGMLTLVASLLLERRIVFVARSRDTVTAAVQAAQALIYPFRWQHIYLPLLPKSLVEYLSAPMPYLVGLPADLLTAIRHSNVPMSEVTLFDLDLHTVDPPPGSPGDDGRLLPYGRQLSAALQAVFKTLRSPTEYESSPVITGVMQEYFVRLFGSYRRFIHSADMEPLLRSSITASAAPGAVRNGGMLALGRDRDRDRDSAAARHTRADSKGDGSVAGASPMSGGNGAGGRQHDDMLRGYGMYFDQPAFVAHRRSEVVRFFLNTMRHSQLYQMFINDRLRMAASGEIELPGPGSSMHGASALGFGGFWPGHGHSHGPGGHSGAAMGVSGSGMSMTLSGSRPRITLSKSSSATNLVSQDRSSSSHYSLQQQQQQQPQQTILGQRQGQQPGPIVVGDQALLLPPDQRRSDGIPGGSGGGAGPMVSGGGAGPSCVDNVGCLNDDPFEYRVDRYPEQRRRLRERLRAAALAMEGTPMGNGGAGGVHGAGGRLGKKGKGHRRTDSEDLYRVSQQVAALSLQSESMRRITTYPGLLDLSTPSLTEPSSYFLEWDVHDDEQDSATPSPRDREHHRSWSGNSLYSADSGDLPGAAAGRGLGGPRENTPLRRPSASLLSSATKTYMPIRGFPSDVADVAASGNGAAQGGPAAGAGASGVQVPRSGAFGSVFVAGPDDAVAALELKGGVQVKTNADGHRTYEGSIKDMFKLAASEAKNGILTLTHTLASPRNSPRGKDKEDKREREREDKPWRFGRAQNQQANPHLALPPPQQHQAAHPMNHSFSQGTSPHGPGDGGGPTCHGPGDRGYQQQQQQQQQLQVPLPPMSGSESGLPGGTRPVEGPTRRQAACSDTGVAPGASGSGFGNMAAAGLAAAVGRVDRTMQSVLSGFSGLKHSVAQGGRAALGYLPHNGYKPQTTGEKAARFKSVLASGTISLIDGSEGKLQLKQPHAPQRPLSLTGHVPPTAPTPAPTPAASPANNMASAVHTPASPPTPLTTAQYGSIHVPTPGSSAAATPHPPNARSLYPGGHAFSGAAVPHSAPHELHRMVTSAGPATGSFVSLDTPPQDLAAWPVNGTVSLPEPGRQMSEWWDPFETAGPTHGASKSDYLAILASSTGALATPTHSASLSQPQSGSTAGAATARVCESALQARDASSTGHFHSPFAKAMACNTGLSGLASAASFCERQDSQGPGEDSSLTEFVPSFAMGGVGMSGVSGRDSSFTSSFAWPPAHAPLSGAASGGAPERVTSHAHAQAGSRESYAPARGLGAVAVAVGGLQPEGSSDYAAFASATSPREVPAFASCSSTTAPAPGLLLD